MMMNKLKTSIAVSDFGTREMIMRLAITLFLLAAVLKIGS
jgi:hypothetical protein